MLWAALWISTIDKPHFTAMKSGGVGPWMGWCGPGERVLQGASVADVVIGSDGIHTMVYNDTRPGRLVETLRTIRLVSGSRV